MVAGAVAGTLVVRPASPAADPPRAVKSPVAGLPLAFVENRGQLDRRAKYYLQGSDTSVYFTRKGLALSLTDPQRAGRRWNLKLRFKGASADARPVGQGRSSGVVSYFRGRPKQWKTGLPTYSKVAYRDLWPGIDLVYSGTGKQLKYEFVVAPGADPRAIDLGWRGATGLDISARGELEVATPVGKLRDEAPRSYQLIGGRRVAVASAYAKAGGRSYGFRLGSYDRSRPLVIDPAMLVYSGYIGGTGDEAANNVALDAAGNLYVTGTTTSSDFPTSVGPDTSFNETSGLDDVFVAKVKPDGTGLVYAGYIGGAKRETGINIAVDGAGAAYVDGSTSSSETDGFPVTGGPDTTYNGGPQDAFVAKVKPDGTGLAYAGYVGGGAEGDPADNNEQSNGLALDAAGNAYVSGFTASDEGTFPDGDGFGAVPGFDQSIGTSVPGAPPGFLDAFVVKVKADGSGLDYGTYIGGGAVDAGTGLALDAAGNAYVDVFAGSDQNSASPFGGFPITPGSFDTTFNGPPRGFPPAGSPAPDDVAVVKLNPSGTALVYATYIGGAGPEQPFGNTVDSAGNLYLTGQTSSGESTFPDGDGFGAIPGFDRVLNAGPTAADPVPTDSFVAKLNAAGSALDYATYIGGSKSEQSVAIDLNSVGGAYIFGTTDSDQATFPVTGGPDSTYNGGPADAFVAQLNAAGTGLGYAGYVGGSGNESGIGVAVDASGDAYVAGNTDSAQSTFPVSVGPDLTKNGSFGSTDAFVAKIRVVPAQGEQGSPPPGCPAGTSAGVVCVGNSVGGLNIRGTAGADRIVGSSRRDVIRCGAGNDVIFAGAGNDTVRCGAGNDTINGGPGRDTLFGEPGKDRVRGDAGNDRLSGGSGGDRIGGGSGKDVASGGSGSDRIAGNGARDRISGQAGNDRLAGNSANDRLSGGAGKDSLVAGTGRDRLLGGKGNDRLNTRDRRRGDLANCGESRRDRDRASVNRGDRVRGCERVRRRR